MRAGRTRWKTENEHNNTLKNHGYQLAHNFGHGKEHLSSLLATLILLSFLFHEILMLLDMRYKAVRGYLPRRMFFQQLRTILFYQRQQMIELFTSLCLDPGQSMARMTGFGALITTLVGQN